MSTNITEYYITPNAEEELKIVANNYLKDEELNSDSITNDSKSMNILRDMTFFICVGHAVLGAGTKDSLNIKDLVKEKFQEFNTRCDELKKLVKVIKESEGTKVNFKTVMKSLGKNWKQAIKDPIEENDNIDDQLNILKTAYNKEVESIRKLKQKIGKSQIDFSSVAAKKAKDPRINELFKFICNNNGAMSKADGKTTRKGTFTDIQRVGGLSIIPKLG